MHLRWIYVKDHALLFISLTAMSVAALVIAVLLVDDPARGLLLGITPTLFALLVWALTNRAGYAERVPETLAHQRTAATDGEVSAWDPFELDRPVSPEAPPAPIGNASTTTPPGTTAPDAKAERTATGPEQETTGKATRPSNPNGPGQEKQRPTTTGQAGSVAKRTTSSRTATTPSVRQPNPDRREKPDGSVAPPRSGQERSSSNQAPSDPGDTVTGKPSKVRKPNPNRPRPGSSDETPPAAGQPAAPPLPGDGEPSPRKKKGRKAAAEDSLVSNPPKTPPPEPDASPEHLTPAEAAKRDAEARKSRKRKGKPDEAA